MLPTSAGIEPATPGLQSSGASNWATEAGKKQKKQGNYFKQLNSEFVQLSKTGVQHL